MGCGEKERAQEGAALTKWLDKQKEQLKRSTSQRHTDNCSQWQLKEHLHSAHLSWGAMMAYVPGSMGASSRVMI